MTRTVKRLRVYHYNDFGGFKSTPKLHNVKSNLCTWFYPDRKRFCGNYCSRHNDKFSRRCWRHPRPRPEKQVVVLLMISSSERMYNRDLWTSFLAKSQEKQVPFELVVYHEDMLNCTVRHPHNLLSRLRPFPDLFGQVLPLKNLHGSLNFAQIYIRMLKYGSSIPQASKCIVLTERTLPVRSPYKIYRQAMKSKCHIDTSYNVSFDSLNVPRDLPTGPRNKPYSAVNNLAQGLFTVKFLKRAIPSVPLQCKRFGIALTDSVYKIVDSGQFERWRLHTGSNPSEFWLLNSFLLQNMHNRERPMKLLKKYMEIAPENDKYTVAEIPQYRDGVKRTLVFKDYTSAVKFRDLDSRTKSYYDGLDFVSGVSLQDIVKYLRKYKKRALFFRQVELP